MQWKLKGEDFGAPLVGVWGSRGRFNGNPLQRPSFPDEGDPAGKGMMGLMNWLTTAADGRGKGGDCRLTCETPHHQHGLCRQHCVPLSSARPEFSTVKGHTAGKVTDKLRTSVLSLAMPSSTIREIGSTQRDGEIAELSVLIDNCRNGTSPLLRYRPRPKPSTQCLGWDVA